MDIGRELAASGLNRSFDDKTLTNSLTAWESRVLSALQERYPDIAGELKYATRLPLHKLPVKMRSEFIAEYRSIIGLDHVLNTLGAPGFVPQTTINHLERNGIVGSTAHSIGNIWERLRKMRSIDSGNAYGLFDVDPGDTSLIGRIYRNMNLQFDPRITDKSGLPDPKNMIAGPSNYFGIGRNSIPTVASLTESTTSLPSLVGKKLTVFDIETAGLTHHQIREIAYQTFSGDPDGRMIPGASNQIALRPAQFNRGVMYHGGETLTLENFMNSKYGLNVAGMRTSNGDDFIDAVQPFLRQVLDSDYIIGHNIRQFDIEQIFTGLAGTSRYKNNQQFAAYVDDVYNKFRSSTIDTLELVRNHKNLAGLEIASELGPEGKLYSIQNLLMKTNLAELVGIDKLGEAMGYDASTGTFLKGLHFGDVDALVTSAIVNNYDQLDITGGLAGARTGLAAAIRTQVMSSSALTPFTNIEEQNIIPGLRSFMRTHEGGIGKVTPIEQAIWAERNLRIGTMGAIPGGQLTPSMMSTKVRMFDRYSSLGTRRMQEKLSASHIPFAGLSFEERRLGTSLSKITSTRGMQGLAADSLVSNFGLFDLDTIEYETFSGRNSIPAQILESMGMLKPDGSTLLKMSAIDSTNYNNSRAINLVYQFQSQAEVDTLADELLSISGDYEGFRTRFGITGDATTQFDRFRNAVTGSNMIDDLRANGLERGVSIGQLYDDQSVVNRVWSLLEETTIREQLRDEDTFRFGLPFLGVDRNDTGGGVVRTAGAVLDRFLTVEDRANIGRSVANAGRVYDAYEGMMGDREARLFATILGKSQNSKQEQAAIKAFTNYVDIIKPNAGKVALGAIGATSALLLYNRKREQDKYDVAISQMPTEANRYKIADYVQMNLEAGYNSGQQLDPLATASIVANLDATQIGHTSMSWDRNSNLYGGVL
jgi:hypothetical protein